MKKSFYYLVLAIITYNISDSQAHDDWLATPESIDQFRNQVESFKPNPTAIELSSVRDISIELENRDLSIRVYQPAGTGLKPALIYVHGACWVAGSLDSHDEIARYLAKESGSVVVAIDYRLAPEHKYPAAHNDVYDATKWVWDNAVSLGIDQSKFAISGESAGAYFAAATTIRALQEKNAPKITFQLLVYAGLDGGGSAWPECKAQYFEHESDVRSDIGSPLWAQNLAGLPSTYNVFGQYEISRVEEELFMLKLTQQGVQTYSYMVKDVAHDVVNWMAVRGDLVAHKKAVEYIKMGFGIN